MTGLLAIAIGDGLLQGTAVGLAVTALLRQQRLFRRLAEADACMLEAFCRQLGAHDQQLAGLESRLQRQLALQADYQEGAL